MKKMNHLDRLATPIDHVWDTRLIQPSWHLIENEAKRRKTTCSWVVRFCVFRLINQYPHENLQKFESAFLECKSELMNNTSPLHRFQLCLYGEDVKLLQTTALYYEISVTMLIRIALHLYLTDLINDEVSHSEFYWLGIKFIAKALRKLTHKHSQNLWTWQWSHFLFSEYYGMPPKNHSMPPP